jgi:hypothetical protein
MAQDGSSGMSVVVRAEWVDGGYDVVVEDGDEVVLAHYATTDWDAFADPVVANDHAREDAERFAEQVRRLLQGVPAGCE